MQQVEAAARTPVAAMPAITDVDDPRAFARGVVIGAVVSAPAWVVVVLAVQTLLR